MDWMFLGLIICGCYGVGDGIGSIIEYWQQTTIEHVPRIIRSCAGTFVVYATFLIFDSVFIVLTPGMVGLSAIAGAYLGWTRRLKHFRV